MAQAPPILAFKVCFPPSVNCLYTGKDRRRKSDAYEKWCREAWSFIAAARADLPGFQTITEPVGAWYRHGEFSDKRVLDAENYAKALSDLLKEERILKDDSLIRCSINEWVDDVEQGYTEVVIVPLARMRISIV